MNEDKTKTHMMKDKRENERFLAARTKNIIYFQNVTRKNTQSKKSIFTAKPLLSEDIGYRLRIWMILSSWSSWFYDLESIKQEMKRLLHF